MRPWVRRAIVVGVLAGVVVVAARRMRAARATDHPAGTTGAAPAPPAPPGPVPATGPARAVAAVADEPAWTDPDEAGDCPVSHPIKGKLRTGIFHPPGAFAYERTHADRCYRDAAAAEADGLRAAKR